MEWKKSNEIWNRANSLLKWRFAAVAVVSDWSVIDETSLVFKTVKQANRSVENTVTLRLVRASLPTSGAPNENIDQNHLNIELLNVF